MQATKTFARIVKPPLLIALLSTLVGPPVTSAADSWNTFQNGGSLVISKTELPIEWSPHAGVAWQTELAGYGQSSPVVDGDLVYVTSTSGEMKDNLHIQAIDRRTGEPQWGYDTKNSSPEKNTNYVSRAAPTPVCDVDGVIASFEGGNVMALDREGKVRWQRDLVADFGAISARHGLGSSLEQDGSRVFVWIERQEDPYLIALSKKTGETVWKTPGLGATSWSSPRLVPTADGVHLVCSASGKIAGFNPETGDKLWDFTDISNNTACTPVPIGEGKFLIGASDGRGEQSGGGAASNGVIQITKQDDGKFVADFVWHAKKASSSFGSPIAAGDQVYIVNRAGVLFQLDLATGEQSSATRVASGGIWATPLVVGDHLYLFGYKGTTSVLSLSDGKEIAANRLWEAAAESTEDTGFASGGPVLYAAVVASPYLIIRRGDLLYAIAAQGAPQ